MEIKDNFLKQEEFDKIQKIMMGEVVVKPDFPWFYRSGSVHKADVDNFTFIHFFYYHPDNLRPSTHEQKIHIPERGSIQYLLPILQIIEPMVLWRIKAKLVPRTQNIVTNTFHVDTYDISEEKSKRWTTAIFYMNTNNGYTEFEDGTKVESVANRMVTFPANIKHRGTSCSDKNVRMVINFYYFK